MDKYMNGQINGQMKGYVKGYIDEKNDGQAKKVSFKFQVEIFIDLNTLVQLMELKMYLSKALIKSNCLK